MTMRALAVLVLFAGCHSAGQPVGLFPLPDGGLDTGPGPLPDTGTGPGDVAKGGPPTGGFVVKAELKEDKGAQDTSHNRPPLPAEITFTIFVDGKAAGPTLVASAAGAVASTPLVPVAGGWMSAGELSLGLPHRELACQGYVSFTYKELLVFPDPAGVRGTFNGEAVYASGDVATRHPFSANFTGTVDRQPPTLAVQEHPHPADSLEVTFSEALRPGTIIHLVDGTGAARELRPLGDKTPAATFVLPGAVGALAGRRLVAESGLVDLAGNAAPELPLPSVEPAEVPLLVEDGFEKSPPMLIAGAQMDTVHPIAGTRSLFLPGTSTGSGAGRATWRMTIFPGDSVVRATLRAVLPSENDELVELPISVVATGGQVSSGRRFPMQKPLTAVGNPPVWLSAEQTIEIPLPPGAQGEVVIDIDRTAFSCGPSPYQAGALLDDVRLE
jgi:hypothetical protein